MFLIYQLQQLSKQNDLLQLVDIYYDNCFILFCFVFCFFFHMKAQFFSVHTRAQSMGTNNDPTLSLYVLCFECTSSCPVVQVQSPTFSESATTNRHLYTTVFSHASREVLD